MDSRARQLVNIGKGLFSKKRRWDELCQELAEQTYPLRADFTRAFSLSEDFSEDLMDSYPVLARETLGTTVGALLRQDDWFAARTDDEETDENPAVAQWLERATSKFRRLVYDRRANFNRATAEADHDWVAFGNPVLSIEESPTRDHFLFRSWHPKECAWMENEVGKIDHIHRKMPMTARNIVRRWKDVHPDIRRAAETDPTKEFNVAHIVLPVDEVYGDDKAKRRRYRDMPFLSLYIDCDHEEILGEGGLPVFNYVVPRWRTVSNWPQGFSPASLTALPNARMLQSMARVLIEQGEKAVDPPTIGSGEAFRDAINLYAGGHTHVDLGETDDIRKVFQQVDVGGNLGIGLEMKQDVRGLIAECYLLNKLMLPPQEKTAFETQARLDEYRRGILPFTGPVEAEYHLPMLDTAFQMAVRNGQFDIEQMPEELEGRDITFAFESPLNTAEGRAAVSAFQESIQIVAASAQMDDTIPTMMDFKQMTRDAVKGTGAKTDWFKADEARMEDEERQRLTGNLVKAAQLLQGGAAVGQQVADTTVAMREAGLAA